MKNIFFVFILFGLLSVHAGYAQVVSITELCELPTSVTETSGLENGPNDWFWTHNDSGNPAELFCLDTTGTIHRTVSVVGDSNTDWEDIAKDNEGNLYIGNFGNNALNRTDLRIVKIPSIDTCTGTTYVTDTIRFSYPDQTSFPPNGTYGNFDMEAMFFYQNELHLFSKDRSDPSEGYTKHYTLPTTNGTYVANLVDSFQTGHASYIFAVTSADISEDGQSVVLLSSNKLWVFSDYTGIDFFSGTVLELDLSIFSQKEGVCFRNDFMYVTDEASFGLGGKMYRIHPGVFISVNERDENLNILPVYNSTLELQRVNIELDNDKGPYSWKLLSKTGKLISEGTVADKAIQRRDLPTVKGFYVIQVFTPSGYATPMMIKL